MHLSPKVLCLCVPRQRTSQNPWVLRGCVLRGKGALRAVLVAAAAVTSGDGGGGSAVVKVAVVVEMVVWF